MTDTAMAARFLTGMTNFITTDRTGAAMGRTGALATGPTEMATGITILLSANRTGRYAAGGAENLLAGVALLYTVVTNDMPIAIKHDLCRLSLADIAAGTVQRAIIAVA